MCLLSFALNQHTQYPLILMANRDEFFSRKTHRAHFWKNKPGIFAGKDLQAGGTWMGISKTGKWGALTNYRDLSMIDPKAPSRGALVTDYLESKLTPLSYAQSIAAKNIPYNGFNLIIGDQDMVVYYSNLTKTPKVLQGGIYGLSNHLIDTPWPKLNRAKNKLITALKHPITINNLLDNMHDDWHPEEDLLPDTGIGLEKEKMLSPMFIKSPIYGTCSSTALIIDTQGHMTFGERWYNSEDGVPLNDQICQINPKQAILTP